MNKRENKITNKKHPKRRQVKEVTYSYAGSKRPQGETGQRGLRTVEGKKKSGKLRGLLTLSIIVSIIAVLIFLNSLAPGGLVEFGENFFAGIGSGPGFPVHLPDEKVESIYLSGGDILVLTDAALLEYNANAKQIFNRQHGMANPVVDFVSLRTLVYDRAGKNIKIENKHTTVFETKMDNAILTGAISENGSFVIATQSQGYNAEVYVYDGNSFLRTYLRQLVSGDITSVDISANGKNIVYSVVDVKDGRFISSVYICNIKKEEPVSVQTYENTFVFSVEYKNEGKVAVLGDTIYSAFDSDGGNRKDIDFNGKKIQLADNTQKGQTALVLTQDISNRLVIISPAGEVTAEFNWPEDLRDIAATYEGVYGLYGQKLAFLDLKGNLQQEWEVGSDVTKVAVQDSNVVLLKNSEISILSQE